jgi:hypothetical protein
MANTILLICLLAVLVAFLLGHRLPRAFLVQAILLSAWIYAGAFWLTLGVVHKLKPEALDGFLPYLPPIVPVAAFIAWYLCRAKGVVRR